MNQRTQYFIQILEKIGTPLLGAIIAGPSPTDHSGQDDARKMAGLLSKSVETSISFGQMIDVNALGDNSDRVRVAMMAIAANLVAENYKIKQQAPGEAENKRMVSALQAALTFSENFSPSAENIKALQMLEASGQNVDIHQTNVQYIQAFVPVIAAITEFSLGHKEPKLMTEIASRLIARADEIASSLTKDAAAHKPASLGVLRALASLYSDCHRAETARVMKMGEDERAKNTQDSGGLPLDNIWKAFDLRVSLVEALTQNILGVSGTSTSNKAPETPKPIPQAAPAAAPQIFQAPPAVQPAPAQSAPQSQTGANPMSMFAKKPAADAQPAVPAPPAAASPPPPPPPPPPPSPPAKPAGETGGNPMSFFKNPKKDDAED